MNASLNNDITKTPKKETTSSTAGKGAGKPKKDGLPIEAAQKALLAKEAADGANNLAKEAAYYRDAIKRLNKDWQDEHSVLIRELSRQLAKETLDLKSYVSLKYQHLSGLLWGVFALPYPRRFVVLACAMPYWIWIADFTLGSLSRGMRASSWHHDGFEPFALTDRVVLADPRWLPQRLYFQRWIVDALGLAALFGVWFCLVDNCQGDLRPKYTALAVAIFFGPASGFGYMFTNLCDCPLTMTDSLATRRTRHLLIAIGAWSWLISQWIAIHSRMRWLAVGDADAVGGGTGLKYNGGMWGRGAIVDWVLDGVGGNFHLNMCYCMELYLAICCAGYYVWRLLTHEKQTTKQSTYPGLEIMLLLAAMFLNAPFALISMALLTHDRAHHKRNHSDRVVGEAFCE